MSSERALTPHELESVVREAFGPLASLRAAHELTGGTFNTAYALHLSDGRQAVLKVAPPPDVPVLTYEQHLLHTEALCLRTFAQRATAPVPRLLHAGIGTTALSRDYVVTSVVPGASWTTLAHSMTAAERRLLRHQLGGHVAAMHHVTGDGPFGYPAPASPLTGRTWTEAYQRTIAALMGDAERYEAPLPLPRSEMHERLASAAENALAPVQMPVLVHFDLWNGNIFIDRSPQGPLVTGLIDHERAFWGDPAADFASSALLGDITDDVDFLAEYHDAGGPVVLDAATRYRLHLYRAQLALIMLVETVLRRTAGPEHHQHNRAVALWLTDQLRALEDGPQAQQAQVQRAAAP